jgi:hypothetical protein
MDYILAINAVAGVWSLVFCIVPLFLLNLLAFWNDLPSVASSVIVDWSSFASPDGQGLVFGMGILSWVYTIISYYIITETTALWMTMASSLGVLLQLGILAAPSMGPYQSPPDATGWFVNVALCVLTVAYVYHQSEATDGDVYRSRIGQYYARGMGQPAELDWPKTNLNSESQAGTYDAAERGHYSGTTPARGARTSLGAGPAINSLQH